MFFQYLLERLDASPFDMLGEYIDEGPQVIITGNKQVTVNGQTLYYGPTVNFTVTFSPEKKSIRFTGNQPQASFGSGCRATISAIDFEPNGKVFADANWRGINKRRELHWGTDA
jgi:hypothetical protein